MKRRETRDTRQVFESEPLVQIPNDVIEGTIDSLDVVNLHESGAFLETIARFGMRRGKLAGILSSFLVTPDTEGWAYL